MMKIDFVKRKMLPAFMALALVACSNSELLEEGAPELPETHEGPVLNITIGTPSSGNVIYGTKASTRAGGGETTGGSGEGGDVTPEENTYPDEADEAKINNLTVYLFEGKANGKDAEFSLYGEPHEFGEGTNQSLTQEGDAVTCTIPLTSAEVNKVMKVAIVANEPVSAPGSLADLKNAQVKNKITATDQAADVLIAPITTTPGTREGEASAADNKWFSMAAMAKEGTSEEITISATGNNLEATLVRNVARVDIVNFTPNLTITGAVLNRIVNTSYLFGSDNGTVKAGTSYLSNLSLYPLTEFTEKANAGIVYSGDAVSADITDAEKEAIYEKNTNRAFYMYEEGASASYYTKMTIFYTLRVNGEDRNGSVEVPFKVSDPTAAIQYPNIMRNHRYRVIVGDGTTQTTGRIKLTFVVDDWINENEIEDIVTPD